MDQKDSEASLFDPNINVETAMDSEKQTFCFPLIVMPKLLLKPCDFENEVKVQL